MSARLRVRPEEASERLGHRVALGSRLHDSPPTSVQDLELEIEKWDDFNTQLLEQLFDSEEVARAYRDVHVGRVLIGEPAYAMDYFLELLTRKLANLRSILTRMNLFEVSSENPASETHPSGETETPSLDVFVSHSSADAELVEHLVDLIQHALDIAPERIRATSVDSYRLPGGVNTSETLRREAIEARVFVGVISSRSLASVYMVFELGARWGSGRSFVPVVTSDLDAGTLDGPLRDINYKRCSRGDLHSLIRELGEQLEVTPRSPDRYQRHLERVVEADELLGESRPAGPAIDEDEL